MSTVTGSDTAVLLGTCVVSAAAWTIGAVNDWPWTPLLVVPVLLFLIWPHLPSEIARAIGGVRESLIPPNPRKLIDDTQWPTE